MSQALSPEAILGDLIAFKSISRTPNICLIEYLEHWAYKNSFNYQRISHPSDPARANLLAWAGPAKAGGLLLSAHTDVVPVKNQHWQSDPFKLRVEDGRLYGRGSTDMKGFIAALCASLANFDLRKLKKPLSLLFSYDEESGCEGSAYACPMLKNYLGFLPEAALIGEPTDFKILRMHSGHVTLSISAQGRGAHSSEPELGISAIKAMHKVLSQIFKLEEELKSKIILSEYFPRPYIMLNVGSIEGGSAVNIIPDYARIILGFRPLPHTNTQEIIDTINNIIQHISRESGALISLKIEQACPAMITEADTKLERILKPFAKQSSTPAAAFSCDAGNLSAAGIDCLIFGPGSITIAHQANEFIQKDDLENAAQKIPQIIEKYLT